MNQPTTQAIVLDNIFSRHSNGGLIAPAPSADEFAQIIQAATAAPDYHQLTPWRFKLFLGEDRQQLADIFYNHAIASGETDPFILTRLKKMPFRAPAVLLVVLKYQPDIKATHSDQLLSCGAAVQNALLTIQAMGYASIWRSGHLAHEPGIKQQFDLGDADDIVGFIYIGTAAKEVEAKPKYEITQFML